MVSRGQTRVASATRSCQVEPARPDGGSRPGTLIGSWLRVKVLAGIWPEVRAPGGETVWLQCLPGEPKLRPTGTLVRRTGSTGPRVHPKGGESVGHELYQRSALASSLAQPSQVLTRSNRVLRSHREVQEEAKSGPEIRSLDRRQSSPRPIDSLCPRGRPKNVEELWQLIRAEEARRPRKTGFTSAEDPRTHHVCRCL